MVFILFHFFYKLLYTNAVHHVAGVYFCSSPHLNFIEELHVFGGVPVREKDGTLYQGRNSLYFRGLIGRTDWA